MKMTNDQIRAKYPQTADRIIGERRVIRRLVTEAIAKDLNVSVNNGEDWEIQHTTSVKDVMDNIMTTDEDYIRVCDAGKAIVATFRLIYGNSPGEVIADHSTNPLAYELYERAIKGDEV